MNFAITPYSIQYAGVGSNFSSSNKTDLTSGTMAPGRYFLIKEGGGTTNGVALPAPDATGTIAMGNTSGKVALVAGGVAVHREMDEDAGALQSCSREEYGRANPANWRESA